MTIIYTFYVKFENLIFTRNGNNLVISDEIDAGFSPVTEPNFFLNPDLHLHDGINAYDNSGDMQSYMFDNQIKIYVNATNQWFEGTNYNEIVTPNGSTVLTGGGGNDEFISTSGDFSQTFQGDAGNDIYYSGPGTDTFIGGEDFDTYVFRRNDGNDGIIDYNPGDYIRFVDVGWDELTFTNSDNNLHITYGDSSVTINHFFNADGSIYVNALDTIITSESETPHSIANEADFHTTYFTNKYFSNLKFTRDGNDLVISTISDNIELATYTNFFNGGTQVETVTALNDEGLYQTYNILTDTEIYVNPTGLTYLGTDYNEIIAAPETAQLIKGGAGNDTVISASTNLTPLRVEGNTGDDTFIAGAGADTFVFNIGDGHDVLHNSDIKDTLVFNDAVLTDLTFTKIGTSLRINYEEDTLTITDFYDEDGFVRENAIDVFYAYGSEDPYSIQENAFWGKTYRASDAVNGKIVGTNDDDRVLGGDYVSSSDKGLAITTYAGNDYILGTSYNDTINSSSGNNVVKEVAGKNKITTGSGNDTLILAGYSINTVNAGNGNNTINVKSMGTNKISAGKNNDTLNLYFGNNNANLGTGDNKVFVHDLGINKVSCGSGNDIVTVNAGYNNINAGHGNNTFYVTNGINTLTSGKNYDTFHIYGGNNTINSSLGNDEFYIYATDEFGKKVDGGYNTINCSNGNNKFTINAGNNIIKAGTGENIFTVTNGINYITSGSGNDTFTLNGGINSVVGGAGNDTYVTNRSATFSDIKGNDYYNLSAIDDYDNVLVSVSDYSGNNSYVFSDDILDKDVLFSVSVGSKPKMNEFGDYVYTLGKNIALTVLDEKGQHTTGIDITGLANISEVTVGGYHYQLDVHEVAQEVAHWLVENHFTSTDTVFTKGTDEDIEALLAIYNERDFSGYLVQPNA